MQDKETTSIIEECTIQVQAPLVYKLFEQDGSKYAHPKYWSVLYNEKQILIDDGIDVENERSYFSAFLEKDIAERLEEELKAMEQEGYVPTLTEEEMEEALHD